MDDLITQPEIKRGNFWEDINFDFSYLKNRKLYIHHTLVGVTAATAANYAVFWIAPFRCTITGFWEVHQTLGTDAGAVTLQLEKLASGQALDAGVEVLSTALSLKATIDTVQTGGITNTIANRNLTKGDRLALKDAGVLTAVANVTTITEILF